MCLYNSSRLSEEKNDSMYYNKYRIYPKIEAFSHADAVKRENAIKNFFYSGYKDIPGVITGRYKERMH